ncbi:MAG: YegP family protein [Actinobacteria bacterium]|nr:YegP family protein [Actinomycetota bacterium]
MRFIVRKASNAQYYFNIVAGNNEVVATSETYHQKASALSTIQSIKSSAGGAEVVDQT